MSTCSDGTGPENETPDVGTPGIRFLVGTGQTDTIDATLPQALIVEVRDSLGHREPGIVVRFEPIPGTAALSVATLTGQFSSLAADTTDAEGHVAVLVRLGNQPGAAGLRVSIPVFGWADTTEFTVRAGRAAAVLLEPSDTAVSQGASFQLRALVADRYAHPLPDPVTYQSFDAAASVNSTGVVIAHGPGLARIVARAGGLSSDTSRVDILPTGTIAASADGGVAVVDLDGSGYRLLPIPTADYQGRYPSWLGDTAIAAMDGRYFADLVRVNLSGTVQYLVPNSDTVVLEVWPQTSRDGSWIYFGGLVPAYSTSGISVWRVHGDGSGLERVSPPNTDSEGDTFPSPSPDGTRVAVTTTRFGSFTLARIDLASGGLTGLGVFGMMPRWAPAVDSIAYMGGANASEIWLVSATGGGARRVSPENRNYGRGFDWSPDGRWIIALGPDGLELVQVATGRVVALPGLPAGLSQPAWKP